MPTLILRPGAGLPILPAEVHWLRRDTALPGGAWSWSDALGPRLELEETAGGLRVTAELPGFTAEDVAVRVVGDTLHLHALRRRHLPGGESVELVRRVVPLPPGLDAQATRARLRMGLLTVDLPRLAPAPRAIPAAVEEAQVVSAEEEAGAQALPTSPRPSLRERLAGWWGRLWRPQGSSPKRRRR